MTWILMTFWELLRRKRGKYQKPSYVMHVITDAHARQRPFSWRFLQAFPTVRDPTVTNCDLMDFHFMHLTGYDFDLMDWIYL